MSMKNGNERACRVVVTGGPGGGKTTAADLFRREIGEKVVIVPESGTLVFSGGFPRLGPPEARVAAQRAIYHLQRNLEEAQAAVYPDRILLCDRGTLDGAAYWPEERGEFFSSLHTTYEEELARYDGVIFFETAAAGGMSIEGGNPTRVESNAQAIALDERLRRVWSGHPNLVFIPNHTSFFQKITKGLAALQAMVDKLACAVP
jgi:predicted ATPase